MKNKTVFLFFTAVCAAVSAQNSAKITRVLEYRPAPGQHINRAFPTPEMSDTYENALAFAESCLVGNKEMLGLGSYGGYVIVGFDHSIVNVKGEYDFKGLGNALSGGAEPGIVMVCQDLNKNGVPDEDEPWYELAGSDYKHAETIHDYEITYFRPSPDGEKSDVKWTDNQGGSGVVKHVSFASQATIYPLWVNENKMVFKGTKVSNRAYEENGQWRLPALDWGYIDNHGNNDPIEKNGFKIDWAVDKDGNSVDLDYIDFIKVYTAQLQEAGWLGETSTEIVGIEDLHFKLPAGIKKQMKESLFFYQNNNCLEIRGVEAVASVSLYSMNGLLISRFENEKSIDISSLESGLYIVTVICNNGEIIREKFINK